MTTESSQNYYSCVSFAWIAAAFAGFASVYWLIFSINR